MYIWYTLLRANTVGAEFLVIVFILRTFGLFVNVEDQGIAFWFNYMASSATHVLSKLSFNSWQEKQDDIFVYCCSRAPTDCIGLLLVKIRSACFKKGVHDGIDRDDRNEDD